MDTNLLARKVEAFHDIDPEMQVNTLLTFMYVAIKGYCTQKDLEVALGMNSGSASRNVTYWTDDGPYMLNGKGFILRETDPKDNRYKILTLSSTGHKFYAKLKEKDNAKKKGTSVAG